VRGKRGHPLLKRLVEITSVRQAFASTQARIKRQWGWLIDLEHLLDLPDPFYPSLETADAVRRDVKAYLDKLGQMVLDETDLAVAQHIIQTFHNRWWGLFTCYQVPGLPRTNNDLETFLRDLKTGQRRITGRKAVHDFILRYGRYAAFVDYAESQEELFARLCQVSDDAFAKECVALRLVEAQLQLRHRFQHHRETLLCELEQRWEKAVHALRSG